jgi:hypothetical protein
MITKSSWLPLITTIVMLMCLPTRADAGELLKLGDILASEPRPASASPIP